MTEPYETDDIEDVLSSVRRLVSPEARPKSGADLLVLTPALRIEPESGGPLVLTRHLANMVSAPEPESEPAPVDAVADDPSLTEPADDWGTAFWSSPVRDSPPAHSNISGFEEPPAPAVKEHVAPWAQMETPPAKAKSAAKSGTKPGSKVKVKPKPKPADVAPWAQTEEGPMAAPAEAVPEAENLSPLVEIARDAPIDTPPAAVDEDVLILSRLLAQETSLAAEIDATVPEAQSTSEVEGDVSLQASVAEAVASVPEAQGTELLEQIVEAEPEAQPLAEEAFFESPVTQHTLPAEEVYVAEAVAEAEPAEGMAEPDHQELVAEPDSAEVAVEPQATEAVVDPEPADITLEEEDPLAAAETPDAGLPVADDLAAASAAVGVAVAEDQSAAVTEMPKAPAADAAELEVIEAVALVAETEIKPMVASGLTDQDGNPLTVLDEEALHDIVRQIIREELQGALGERITRNVRKLVRAEIARALQAQNLE